MPFIHYEVYEFDVPKRVITSFTEKERLRKFWKRVETTKRTLSVAIGCYVYSMRAGRGLRPWYVGMTQKLGFKSECFQPSKILMLRDVLDRYGAGNIVLHLIPKVTRRGKFVRKCKGKASHRDIDWLENYLAGLALRKNPKLGNVKGMKFLKEVYVPGVLARGKGRGKPRSGAASLKISLGLD